MLQLHVILGSTRQNRLGEKVFNWVKKNIEGNTTFSTEFIDLRDWPLPFFDEAVSPSMNGGNYTLPLAKKWAQKVAEADAYILITPEYNHGTSAVLKNALDYVYPEWNNKAVAFVAYGGATGGGRAVSHLRDVTAELQMVSVREEVNIVRAWNEFDEQGNIKTDFYTKKLEGLVKQLAWWASALKEARAKMPA